MTINVTKYRLNPDRVFAGTRGSYGMEKLSFVFDGSWDFDTISVTFHPQRSKPIRVPYLPGAEIDIPAEVMAYSGECRFVVSGVTAVDGEVERKAVSLEGFVDVQYTSDDRGGNAKKVTPDVYDLFLTEAKDYMEAALTAAKESGVFDGEDGISISDVKQTSVSAEDGGTNEITVTLSNDKAFSFRVRNGSKGSAGRGIVSITRTAGDGSPGSLDEYTILYTDGTKTKYTVQNGSSGITEESDPTVPDWAKKPEKPKSLVCVEIIHEGDGVYTLSDGWTYDVIRSAIDSGAVVALVYAKRLYYYEGVKNESDSLIFSANNDERKTILYVNSDSSISTAGSYYSLAVTESIRVYTSDGVWKCEKTFAEIETLVNRGVRCIVYIVYEGGTRREYQYYGLRGGNLHLFVYIYGNIIYFIKVGDDGTVSSTQSTLVTSSRSINGYPLSSNIVLTAVDVNAISSAVTEDDNGKVLKVIDGEAVWTDYFTEADKQEIAASAAAQVDTSGLVSKSGGTMTGKLIAPADTDYTVRQMRNVIYVEDGGTVPETQNGDLVLFYK